MSDIDAKNVGTIINNPNTPVTITNYVHNRQEPDNKELDPNINLFYDSLKEHFQNRYKSKLDGRFEITLEVNKEPFSVNYRTNKNIDEAFKAIIEAFNEKGRLLIVGSPGSGKTVLLLKLALELLDDECKAEQIIPVIFNLSSWSIDYKNFDDWLVNVLSSRNKISNEFSQRLLHEKRLVFLLDGLDELARNEDGETANIKRAKCLESLNEYLREGRKAVICCRLEEFVEMQKTTNQDAPVSATVEVRDLKDNDIKKSLLEAIKNNESSDAAKHLLEIIKLHRVFLSILSTPFYFTTALEVFDNVLLKEKNFPSDTEAIKKHLIDEFIRRKIQHTKKLKAFEENNLKTKKWLKWTAKYLEGKQQIILEITDLQPSDLVKKWTYFFVARLVFSLFFTLILSSYTSFYDYPVGQFISTLVVFFVIGAIASANISDKIKPEKVIDLAQILNLEFWFNIFLPGVLFGLFIGIGVGMGYDRLTGFIVGFYSGLSVSIEKFKIRDFGKPVDIRHPYQRIYSALIVYALLIFLALLPLFGLIYFRLFDYLPSYFKHGRNPLGDYPDSLWYLIWTSTFPLYNIINGSLYQHLILRICFWLENSLPLRYKTFLECAAEARILEKDGGQWRFRHQILQEYFANLDK